jgi:organic radical activating enzyme
MNHNLTLKVNEIFYSLQGEGYNIGMPAIFIRLSGCNMNCSFCDTEFGDGKEMSVFKILEEIKQFDCPNIVWTGGEPTLQLNDDILNNFSEYYNCIETNGTNEIPFIIDYVAVSPKSLERLNPNLIANLRYKLSEVRCLFPSPFDLNTEKLPDADNYYISPIIIAQNPFNEESQQNISDAIKFVKQNPVWKLSIQLHKLAGFK